MLRRASVTSRTHSGCAGIARRGHQCGRRQRKLRAGLPQAKGPRVIAHTRLIGGGETDRVTFSLADLKSDEAYEFFCSFLGHRTLMKGVFKIVSS